MQKEFHDQIAIVCKLPFKPADTFNPVGIYILGNGSVQTFLRNLIHPCRIQKYKLSGFRNFGKMPVQKRFSLVILRLFCIDTTLKKRGSIFWMIWPIA